MTNFQNVPRKDKVVKRAFIPKLDAFLFADYKNIEPRLLAFYMAELGDEGFAEVFRAGGDIYLQLAGTIFPAVEQLTDDHRQVAKTTLLAIGYGARAKRVREILGCSWGEATDVLERVNATWPGIQLVKDRIEERLQERGYITTLYGRHLHPESLHKALNALIQGCAADIIKAAMVRVHAGLKAGGYVSHMVLMVHDELIFDCVERELTRLARDVPFWMDEPMVSKVVPIEVDIEVARRSWADKEPYEGAREEIHG